MASRASAPPVAAAPHRALFGVTGAAAAAAFASPKKHTMG